MLTFNSNKKPKRKDIPWVLLILGLIWVFGTSFFHSPWEPFEPFVLAIVKSILVTHSWFIPYISKTPYLKIQPFYFWIYSVPIKLFNVKNIYYIANIVRLLNTFIIFTIVILMARIGLNLRAFKNGRTVVLLLISTIGFINISYQLAPIILVMVGFCLFIYALILHQNLPGISGWILFIGLLLNSLNYTIEYVFISILILILLPILDRFWRTKQFIITVSIGVSLFICIFYLYCLLLKSVSIDFYQLWESQYIKIFTIKAHNILSHFTNLVKFLSWYLVPSWFFVMWSVYKRKMSLFEDKIIQVSVMMIFLFIIFALLSSEYEEVTIFPIIIPIVLLGSLEVDTIRTSIVSLFNWFGIFVFGIFGVLIWLGYILSAYKYNLKGFEIVNKYTQNYSFKFNVYSLLLAIFITFLWLFMIKRKQIRGRELVTNWASGSTYIIILFSSLLLPWFDSILTFKPIVLNSYKYINKSKCIYTNNSLSSALWYYYDNINLTPSLNLNNYLCTQAIVSAKSIKELDLNNWNIIWYDKRPIDINSYYYLVHK